MKDRLSTPVIYDKDLHLIIFTYSFPYGTIEQWLETEIIYAAKKFERITIVPSHLSLQSRNLPDNININTSLAINRKKGIARIFLAAIHALTSRIVYREILDHPSAIFNLRALRKIIIYHDNGHSVAHWLNNFLKQPNIIKSKVVLYTVWMVPQSVGIGMVKQKQWDLNYISRAHRDDLYEFDSTPPYIPFRKLTLQSLNTLFVISEHGQRYVYEKYAGFCPPCEVARVGINDPDFDNSASSDGVFRLVSCSFMIPIKRLNLFLLGLKLFAEKNPQQLINWQHIGDGPLRASLAKLAHEQLPSNVKWQFKGHLSNSAVMAYYGDNPVDVFINVSESEGIPAAIMEAQSCGIPCIATAVGGNPEIVNNTNGILLSSNPTPKEISDALEKINWDSTETKKRRSASKETWRTVYNANHNYEAFINRIIELYS